MGWKKEMPKKRNDTLPCWTSSKLKDSTGVCGVASGVGSHEHIALCTHGAKCACYQGLIQMS